MNGPVLDMQILDYGGSGRFEDDEMIGFCLPPIRALAVPPCLAITIDD